MKNAKKTIQLVDLKWTKVPRPAYGIHPVAGCETHLVRSPVVGRSTPSQKTFLYDKNTGRYMLHIVE